MQPDAGIAPAAGSAGDEPGRPARLQIRLSVDVHMQDLYGWLLAMPATVRGRELLVQVRVARALASLGVGCDRTLSPAPAAAMQLQPAPGREEADGTRLSLEAVEQASARLELGFLAAVPPPA